MTDKQLLHIAMRVLYILEEGGMVSIEEILLGEGYEREEIERFMTKVVE